MTQSTDWWRGCVIYQVYPRSFQDTSGDGIGDIRGIIQRLDHIASLGVDAIWLSPVFTSPMADMGYDVSDYLAVDPLFGDLEAFDTLIEDMPDDAYPDRPWGPGNNPKTAVWEYLKGHPEYEIDAHIHQKLMVTVAPDGFLKKIG